MGARDQFRALLEAGDVDGLCSAWRQVAPHLPQPETRADAEVVMHHARTSSDTVSFRARAYSHAWLSERMLPSGLPDGLKPKAEQMYPKVVSAVGIVVKAPPRYQAAANEIRRGMESAVEDAYANGDTDPKVVSARMLEARRRTEKQLFGV